MPVPIADEVGSRRARRGPTASPARAERLVLPARGRRQRGAVTAETVMVLPVLVAVTLGLAWALALAATQVRVVDAAREVARAAARDETRSDALSLGRRVAPRGAGLSVEEDARTVVARVRVRVTGPAGLWGFLPAVTLRAEAVAAQEQQ